MKKSISFMLGMVLCWDGVVLEAAPKRKKTIPHVLEVKPELIYRQVQVGHRRGSPFYKESRSSDFVDQIYLAPKFISTYNYLYTALIEPAFFTERDQATRENFRIQQAYLKGQLTKNISVLTGRKVEFSGSGYFFNPSDLLHEDKNLVDPLEQKTGKNFTRFTFDYDNLSFGLGYIRRLNNDFREGTGWLQVETLLWDTDVLLSQTYSKELKTTTGLSLARFFTDNLELHVDMRYQARQRKNVEYAQYSAYAEEDSSAFYLLGTRYVLTSKRSFIFEFLNNQSGLLKEELANYYDVLVQRRKDIENSATNEVIPDPYTQLIGRRYIAMAFFDEETLKEWALKFTYLMNTNDQSAFITTELKFKPAPNFSLAYSPVFFSGKPATEFGQQPAHSVHYIWAQAQF